MLNRKKGLKVDYDKLRAWKLRSQLKTQERSKTKPRTKIKQRSSNRSKEESAYSKRARIFVWEHTICPVTGGATSELHHAAGRVGGWLNLSRYWIALSKDGHEWVHRNGKAAEKLGLVRRFSLTYEQQLCKIIANGENPSVPEFYETWDGKPFNPSR